ncbi:hypothetical protein C3B55_00981 [Candidatus Pseudomonas adelgestsugas]|uniref:Uncharacterized protein n=1 Tax=Candidatus Pseudomonas adelgestsugas TaxID=1302376 RepID=A0ABX5R9H7_9PSED|nr:hypothetical protein C3B55_00981 [Candidatus Pseudomonas adelgestsugas]
MSLSYSASTPLICLYAANISAFQRQQHTEYCLLSLKQFYHKLITLLVDCYRA